MSFAEVLLGQNLIKGGLALSAAEGGGRDGVIVVISAPKMTAIKNLIVIGIPDYK